MLKALQQFIKHNRDEVDRLIRQLIALEKPFLLWSDLFDYFNAFQSSTAGSDLADSPLAQLFETAQEATVDAPWIYFALRPRIGEWHFIRLHVEALSLEEISPTEFLRHKERFVDTAEGEGDWTLEIDLTPFERGFPKLKESRSIGRGVEFLNRHLSSRLFDELGRGDKRLLAFLQVHTHQGLQLMLNDRPKDVGQLQDALRTAEKFLRKQDGNSTWPEFADRLKDFGFEPGWGRTAKKVLAKITLLSDILEAPEPANLERFLGTIPMIFNIVILSPHGYFGQENVLGRPDTGGQVVYILDQVRALEKEIRARLYDQGLDISPRLLVVTRLLPEAAGTTCDQRLEKITGTEGAYILRVPFRSETGEVVPHWISRFKVWPYLERFALEAEKEILGELGSRPDLIIGNYSDGNLVACLLSQRLKVTQCNIAHALEKTKYLYSALYWKEMEKDYHFSCQFTADLIAMNTANFIITSTFQEIAGSDHSVGQYESYGQFSMPGLQRVINGINVFDPKFNIVSPGADAEVYFPYSNKEKRLMDLHPELKTLVFGAPGSDCRGSLDAPEKPLIFTMARLDRIKNITSLVEWYGNHPRLRNLANLLIVGGYIDSNKSDDAEEQEQIHRMHELMDRLNLDHQVRWLGLRLDKNLSGELYRYVADHQGVFVQPALFEAFGLTVIEAMTSGLPTFATCYGGPLEIIEDGISGFHINPNHGEATADRLADFLESCATVPKVWHNISQQGINRVESRYTWKLYAKRLITLSCIYGFWQYVTDLERQETKRYLEMFYNLQFRQLANRVPH